MFFEDTKFHGNWLISLSQEDIAKLVKRKILAGALTTCGDVFSFEIRVISEHVEYEKPKSKLFSRWNRKDIRRFEHAYYVKCALREQSSSITFTEEAVCISDGRTGRDSGKASVENGHILVVIVPRSYSQQLYADFARNGLSFRDKLLRKHVSLLKKISGYDEKNGLIDREPPVRHFDEGLINFYTMTTGYEGYFFVEPEGMDDPYDDCSSSAPVNFSRFGMSNLNNIYECYGFAMALVEIYRPLWEQHGDVIIGYEVRPGYKSDGVQVVFGVRKEAPGLKAW